MSFDTPAEGSMLSCCDQSTCDAASSSQMCVLPWVKKGVGAPRGWAGGGGGGGGGLLQLGENRLNARNFLQLLHTTHRRAGTQIFPQVQSPCKCHIKLQGSQGRTAEGDALSRSRFPSGSETSYFILCGDEPHRTRSNAHSAGLNCCQGGVSAGCEWWHGK